MNKKSLTVSFAVLGLIAVQCLIYKVIIFIEYLLLEGIWGGGIIDAFIMVFNTILFMLFSVLICALAIPKLVNEYGISYKFSLIQMFVLYLALAVFQCIIISGSSDFCYNMLELFRYDLDLIYDSVYYYNKGLGYFFIIVLNLIKPAVFMLGLKKSRDNI